MSTKLDARRKIRILSLVEALTVTGPLKPLLMLASSERAAGTEGPAIFRALMTTRRRAVSKEGGTDELYKAADAAGLEYITIQERTAFDPRVLPKMRHAVEAFQPDIVETHDCKSHFLLFILRILHVRLRTAKWIAFHHGYTRTTWRIRLYQQLDRLTLRHADHVVTVCKPFAQALIQRGVAPNNLSVISNAIPERAPPFPHAIAETRAKLGILANDCLALTVGRLSSEKGQDDLIKAFRQTEGGNGVPQLRLVIVGEGPERARLTEMAARLGSRVYFTGHVGDPWPLFHAADLFVLPSHSEGSPLVILEAMASNAAIIATTVGGVPETLTNLESALLVPPRAPQALAEALMTLVRDEALRQKLTAGARLALARFTPAVYAHQLHAVYERVFAGESVGVAQSARDATSMDRGS